MSRRVKELLTEQLRSLYAEAQGGLLLDLTGLDAISTHELRGELKEKDIRLQVIRNRLAKRAFSGHVLEPLCGHLVGPCALVTGRCTVDITRSMVALARKYPAVKLKSGLIEGDVEVRPAEMIAKLKTLSELRNDLAACFLSPARRVAGCARSPGGLIAGCIKAVIARQEGAAA